MTQPLRLFIALELPPEVLRELARVQASLLDRLPRRALRPARPEGLHLTLKFLGDTPQAQLAPILEGLQRATVGLHPFEVAAAGAGCFPNPQRPRVLWVGVTGNLPALQTLQRAVEMQIAPLGFPTEAGAFSPHLTLARTAREASPEDQRRIGELARSAQVGEIARWQVQEIALMQSELRPDGARYTRLGFAKLV